MYLKSCRKLARARAGQNVENFVLIFLEEQRCWYLEAQYLYSIGRAVLLLVPHTRSTYPLWLLDLSIGQVLFFRHPSDLAGYTNNKIF